MLKDSSLEEILSKIDFNNKTFNIIKPEINIGWKMRRMEGHDEQDIKFVLDNKKILGVNESVIQRFKNKMLDYDVSKAYKLVDGKIQELGRGIYEEFY